tara:strand:- start:2210 stop:4216 length:2007 start_codon:yes stop_codon:yes gene_type:complete
MIDKLFPIKRPSQPILSQILSNKDYELFELALDKAEKYKWERVKGIQSNIKDELARDILEWLRYYNGATDLNFSNYKNYISHNSQWPLIESIKLKAESKMTFQEGNKDLINYFVDNPPKTGWGKIYYGNALLNIGEIEKGSTLIKDGYINGNLTRKEQAQVIKKFKHLFNQEDHRKRINELLWDGKYRTASRLIKYVDKDYQKLYEARIGLISFAGGVDDLIARVPKRLTNHPGLVHDRIKWRVKKRKYDSALELLLSISETDPKKLQRPEKFWRQKNILIRRLIDKHQYVTAYELATNHGLTTNADIADAEWMAGWISITFLDNPQDALQHFTEIWNVSSRPISKARAAYWIGKSYEEIGNKEESQEWYNKASIYNLTFYGQLAGAKTEENIFFDPVVNIPREESQESIKLNKKVYAAISLLNEFDRPKIVKKFLKDLADREDIVVASNAMKIATDIERYDFAVQAGKIFYYNNVILDTKSFPIVDRPEFSKIIFPDQSLIHSVIRQESQFDPKAGSHAGAKGLMQLMPYTAKRVSQGLNLEYSKSKLTENPNYNVILGSAYLDILLSNLDGSYILTLAAYNAGESRVAAWIKKYGDPRKDDIDPVNWIELIPFKETRNYVQRVLENVQVYTFMENNNTPQPYSILENLYRGYVGGKTIIKPVKKNS